MDDEIDDLALLLVEAQAEVTAFSELLDINLQASPQQSAAKRARPDFSDILRNSTAFEIPSAPVSTPIGVQEAPEELDQVLVQDGCDQERTDEIDRQFQQLPTDWEIRRKKEHEKTCQQRPGLFLADLFRDAIPTAYTMCSSCSTSEAFVRCLDCSFQDPQFLCGACDVDMHPYAHFHRRHTWAEGFLSPVPPSISFTEDGVRFERGKSWHAMRDAA